MWINFVNFFAIHFQESSAKYTSSEFSYAD